MKNLGFLVAGLILLAACSPDASDTESEPSSATPAIAANETSADTLTGKQAYERVCATCHAEGLNGAPVIGDKKAWSERSPLWEAVLFEHANEGFLNMPSKGGAPDLTALEVEYAAEYMLGLTYPERPADTH